MGGNSMKDLMILSLIIIVVALMLFLHWGKKQEAKAMEILKLEDKIRTERNSILENTVQDRMAQDLAVQDMVRVDLYQNKS